MKWALVLLLAGCDAGARFAPSPARQPFLRVASLSPAPAPAPEPAPEPAPACTAPSLAAAGPLDARDDAALHRCESARTGRGGHHCGEGKEVAALDLARLDRAVRPFDAETLANVRAIAAAGRAAGRRANVFGLVGDSMTLSGAFLRGEPRLAPEVAAALALGDGTVVDFFTGVQAMRVQGRWRDSFGALRAAKVGARAAWAMAGGPRAPLARMLADVSPATAVVLFGGNDAAFVPARTVADFSERFARDLEAIVDALEAAGVVPILNTLARHGDAEGHDDCDAGGVLGNWRIAVQTNALSARVVEIACRRKLPLIDVRDALDAADGAGLGPDAVHPSYFAESGMALDARGLRCGYNVRNYVTLLMLKRVHEATR